VFKQLVDRSVSVTSARGAAEEEEEENSGVVVQQGLSNEVLFVCKVLGLNCPDLYEVVADKALEQEVGVYY